MPFSAPSYTTSTLIVKQALRGQFRRALGQGIDTRADHTTEQRTRECRVHGRRRLKVPERRRILLH